jgi:predicted nucleic acid-binding protein
MSVVDASVWVSRFMPDDAFHEASRAWITTMVTSGELLVAPIILLAEVAGAIARRTGDRKLGYQSVQQIRQVPTLQIIALDESLGDYAAQLASDLQIRGLDATYVAVARRLDIPLVTWDQEQLDRARAVVSAHAPDQDA